MSDTSTNGNGPANFIEAFIEEDIANGKHGKRVHTRFPPEPNGYLHIGHAKAIVINFETARKYGGATNLRMDDTNPTTEKTDYVDSIKEDILWLGYQWEGEVLYASDYFEQLYLYAIDLIEKGLAYVDDSSPEEIASGKGDTNTPGTESPFRNRTKAENLDLFKRMRAGEFADGSRVLRARIDMSSPNMHMRDPILYRIKHEHHHRTGDAWCIYPMYDFAHGQSDSIEGITHSLCSLEFRHHRPLYEWFIEKLGIFPSRQIEFARMNVSYMITSKRRLLRLVNERLVEGWDDPRMPTLAGMRRRGYPPAALRDFCMRTGVAKRDNTIEIELLEYFVREELNKEATRAMAVLDPLKVIITNYPAGQTEELHLENNPEKTDAGTHGIPFGREIYIEREDFMVDPPKKYFRMAPGADVRLKSAYILHCEGYEADPTTGEVQVVYCSYYPNSRSGEDTSGIKAKGTLHWVSVDAAKTVEVRIYDRLFTQPDPTADDDADFLSFVNPESLTIVHAQAEPFLTEAVGGQSFQFLRKGYFTADKDSKPGAPIFNLTVDLKTSYKPT